MGIGIDALYCLENLDANQSPIRTVVNFFLLIPSVTEEDLEGFFVGKNTESGDAKRIIAIIKEGA